MKKVNNAQELVKKFGLGIVNIIVGNRTSIFIVSSALLLGFLMYTISIKASVSPTDQQIEEAKTEINALTLDEDTIETINTLSDQDVNKEAIFDPGRTDPFND